MKFHRIELGAFALLLAACAPAQPNLQTDVPSQEMVVTNQVQAQTPTILSGRPVDRTPTTAPTPEPSPIASPTPVYSVALYKLVQYNDANLYKFDPDILPPILVSHNPPLIARSDEAVRLAFDFVFAYIDVNEPGSSCNPKATLFVSYGVNKGYSMILLSREMNTGIEAWVAELPASDDQGQPLRYYLRISDPKIDLEMGYPLGGALEVFTVPAFIQVDLSPQNPVENGELVLALPWGGGPEAVGLQQREGYPRREGPVALAVALDGRIALLDHVNDRVLIYDPNDQSFNHIPLPFVYKNPGDILQFDRDGKLAIFDPVGEPAGGSRVNVPRLYLMNPDGSFNTDTPVFATYPLNLAADLRLFDGYDSRWIQPISPDGQVNSREEQRLKQNPELPYRFVENQDP